jgi:PAS domain S-box-containing protein
VKEEDINRHWKRIVNTMNDALMIVGTDGTIVMVNDAFESMTGYTADTVIGKSCTLLHCDACEKKRSGEPHWCNIFDKETEIKCRCHIMKRNGACVPVLKNAVILKDDNGQPLGAVETLTDISELDRLDRQIVKLSRQLHEDDGFHGILGKSPVMHRAVEMISKAAQSDAPVIIYGESGTGKELAAKAIHLEGPRKSGPYIQLNCAALNESLLESELFGHIKGAFTGAYRHRTGRFEAAHGGDIFLDEIGDVPLPIQVKLLRVLESRQFERVGDHHPVFVDVRVITATNRNLKELIQRGLFREDLFFRINVIPIHLPPLRKRKEDIAILVSAFMKRFRKRTGKQITNLSSEAMSVLMNYPWPGNVRELKSSLEYAFVIAEDGQVLPEHLPQHIAGNICECLPNETVESFHTDALAISQKAALIDALRQTGGNQTRAAKILGVSRVTVWNRMRKYGIDLKKVLVP